MERRHQTWIRQLIIVINTASAEVTLGDLIEYQEQMKYLNSKVEIIKRKDSQYYLNITDQSRGLLRRTISSSNYIFEKLGLIG